MGDKWNKEDEWEEEAAEPLDRRLVVVIVLGMAVLAAVICTGLWYFTHADRTGEENQNFIAQATASPKPVSEPSSEPMAESTHQPTPGAAQTHQPAPEETPGAAQTHQPAPEATPGVAQTWQPAPEATSGAAQTWQPAPEATPGTAHAQTPEPGTQAAASGSVQGPGGQAAGSGGNASMSFTAVKESVMPKDVLNLRSAPTTTDEGNIVTQIENGEVIVRTGINENTGWSEVEYQGQVLYAVSQYLTTNLNYQPPTQPSDPNRVSTMGGRIIIFTSCDDWISPKEYVNLRTEPSTSEGNDTVSCRLNYGEKVHRTGYSADAGWSRVEHNGQVLYVVTSFMIEAAADESGE